MGTVWAQRRELLADFVNAAAAAVGAGGWCDFACLCQKKEGTVFFCPFSQVF